MAQAIHSLAISENRKLAVLMPMALTYVDAAGSFVGVTKLTPESDNSALRISQLGRIKMSVRSAVLVEEFSATWFKNALAGTVGALVLLVLLILFP